MKKPIKLSEMPKRETVKPKSILPNMVRGHYRNYRSGEKVWIDGHFRKQREKQIVPS